MRDEVGHSVEQQSKAQKEKSELGCLSPPVMSVERRCQEKRSEQVARREAGHNKACISL